MLVLAPVGVAYSLPGARGSGLRFSCVSLFEDAEECGRAGSVATTPVLPQATRAPCTHDGPFPVNTAVCASLTEDATRLSESGPRWSREVSCRPYSDLTLWQKVAPTCVPLEKLPEVVIALGPRGPWVGDRGGLSFSWSVSLSLFFFSAFSGPHLRHVELPRLGG